ncbi:MFS transporter [Actinacidiphila bryophytorum]|uniref:Transmembrane secretion effector n=1 Tax=Actinacidiphila bryophytorum TaxID=1436133 RepID=A0A9W4MFM2_9ACTN|nr:MFS transporter [Actinacidiphila bryophytorum]MBM9435105.1 MFS transporter [Actinacidiphila bryophytorum]MBN6546155.1 MFS transporter [Actinacidiphila bryophytorum]CAG7643150.1 Transmembrane secretion effector [Actinacidiphila bryophytorum]
MWWRGKREKLGRDFGLVWGGQLVDQFGSQVSRLALPLVAIVTLHASDFEVAALGAAGALPVLLVSLPAGAVVDRVRRRPVMIWCAAGCALAMGSVPLANALWHLTLAQLYAVALVVGSLTVVFDAAAGSLPLLLVGRERLVEATGRMNTGRGLAEMAGPSAGGFLVGALGAARAVSVDAASYVLSAGMLALMRFREPAPKPRAAGTRLRHEIREGLRLVLRHPLLRVMVLADAVTTFLLAGVSAFWLLYVIRELHWSVRAAGLVYGLSLIGGVLGGMAARRVVERVGMSRTMVLGTLLSAPLETVTPLVGRGPAGQWTVALAFTALTATGMVAVTATGSVRQLVCPPDMLGRMTATTRFLAQGLRFLGPLAAGALATWAGLRPALLVLAGATLLPGLILLASPIRSMREVPVHEAYAAGPA